MRKSYWNQNFKNKVLFGRFDSVSLKDLKLYLKNNNIQTKSNLIENWNYKIQYN